MKHEKIKEGDKFGKLTVVEIRVKKDTKNNYSHLCLCECGKERIIQDCALKSKSSVTCGHCNDLCVGDRFGKLVIEKLKAKTVKQGHTRHLCKCDCGKEVFAYDFSLKEKTTVSCGCWRKEYFLSTTIPGLTKHGKAKRNNVERIYRTWQGMKARCLNKNATEYQNYGGRGISICKEWEESFIVFLNWSNGSGYSKSLTIERIDNNGNYEPSNCKWATIIEQQNNKRTNHFIVYNGKRQTVSELGNSSSVSQDAFRQRISRGWDTEPAVNFENVPHGSRLKTREAGKKEYFIISGTH